MAEANLNEIFQAKLTTKDFNRLSEFIYNEFGIKMPPVKQTMLQSRLQKRLRALNMVSFREYVEYVFSKKGQNEEVIHMMDVVSTNKTDFFREPLHFDFLREQYLPEILVEGKTRKFLKVWSAGCSSGEEAYTIAITLSEFGLNSPLFDYNILATDISTKVLQEGVNAIYKEARIEYLPLNLKRKYFLKSKNRENPTVRLIPEIRQKVTFQRLNLMDGSYAVNDIYDIIFCRNVLIYFDRKTQESVIRKLCYKLKPGGIFFLGHSESITNIDVPLRQIKPTIFYKV